MARKVPKLQPVWEGPFIIKKKRYGTVLYEEQGRKNTSVLNHDQLRLYKSDVVPGWVARFHLKGHRTPYNHSGGRNGMQGKTERTNKPKREHTLWHAADQDRKNE